MSVDLWIERVGAHAKVIAVRLLGGLDWWRYGVERLAALARGIALAVLPGEDRDDRGSPTPRRSPRTSSPPCCGSFARAASRTSRAAAPARPPRGRRGRGPAPRSVPRPPAICWTGAIDLDTLVAALAPGRPVVPIVLSLDAARRRHGADRRLCAALDARACGRAADGPEPQGRGCGRLRARSAARLAPAAIVTTTGFAAGGEPGARRRSTTPTCRCCRP
jgi:cobaltochelatase CobN